MPVRCWKNCAAESEDTDRWKRAFGTQKKMCAIFTEDGVYLCPTPSRSRAKMAHIPAGGKRPRCRGGKRCKIKIGGIICKTELNSLYLCHVKTNKSMSVNKVILIGNVGKDPDVRYVDTNVAVATFTLATTERGYTLANGTKVPDKTEWHNIVLWRGLAEVCEKYVHKGDRLYIEGKIRTRSYDDQKGVRRYITEIYADNMEMLSAPRQNAQPAAAAPAQTHDAPASTAGDGSDLPF